MLKQASVKQLRSGDLSRKDGHIVIAMRRYPRGLKKELRDEYLSSLAPEKDLFEKWKKLHSKLAHDEAIEEAGYEEKFSLSREGEEDLKRLAQMGKRQDVYLVCHCELGQRCHRELLLLLAQKKYAARTDPLFHSYPRFARRIKAR